MSDPRPDDRTRARAPGREALGFGAEPARGDVSRSRPVAIGAGLCAVGPAGLSLALHLQADAVGRAIGVTGGGIDFARLVATVTLVVVAPLAAMAVLRRGSRIPLAVAGSAAAAAGALGGSAAAGLAGLAGGQALAGSGAGAAAATHLPLVADVSPPSAWGAAVATYRAATTLGLMLVVVLVAAAGAVDLTWRFVALTLAALVAMATVVGAALLREGPALDEKTLRTALVDDPAAPPPAAGRSFATSARDALAVPAARRAIGARAILAAFEFPLLALATRYFAEYWAVSASQQAAAVAAMLGITAAGLVLAAGPMAATWCRGPLELARNATLLVTVAGVALLAAAVSPVLGAALVALAVAAATLAVVHVAVDVALLASVPAVLRPVVTALAGGGGALVGTIAVAGVARAVEMRAGAAWGLAALGVVALALRPSVAALGPETEHAVDHRIDVVNEEAAVAASRRDGTQPLLACRGIDFSYGPVQVLFDVNFSIEPGEMVALLGTNGAGKSTLLRVISGVGAPTAGTVRFEGHDITSSSAAARVGVGIVQVPGGRAAFGSMSVLENLRLNAYALGRDRGRVNDAIERAFAEFPRLAERRHQPAATLSGGERQMLALSKAVMTEPRLLLVDELSLGLAPAVVAELLEQVREINRRGTAVVLVEQSVNVALSLVDHAYFMEKGEVRFDGRAADLLERPDVLRSVFLEGAAAGMRGA